MYARQRRNQKGGGQIRGYANPLVQYPDLTPIMTEKRFIEIKLIFQPNDPTLKKSSSNPDYDRLHHVRPFVDNLNEVSKTMMTLGQFVSADEALIPFRGSSFMRVYMKDNPGKYGFKVYQANDPESDLRITSKCTLTSAKPKKALFGSDRYYSSLLLCYELHRKYEQYLIGTIMANRLYGAKDVLDEIKTTEPRGTMNSCYMEDGPPVMVARWKDRRVCTFVSSVQGGALDHVQRIGDSKGNREAINTYAFVKLYNQYMVYKGLLLQREHSEDVSIPSRHQMIEKLLSLLEKHIREVKARDLDETEDELDEDGSIRCD
eukprot:g54685.t1